MSTPATKMSLRPGLRNVLEAHRRLDGAIDETLGDLVVNTEASAMATIAEVRRLYDSAQHVAGLATGVNPASSGLDGDIDVIIAHLANVGRFVGQLPARMSRDLENAKIVAGEISELSLMVEAIRSISVQSQLLAVNTAIQASRAGTAGAAFRIMADEMRVLAADAKSVSARIIDGLARANQVVEGGMAASIRQATDELAKVSDTSTSIATLREKLADMNSQHRERLDSVAQHNSDLARDIAEVLGHIQYQDVVRQSIERIRDTVAQRNACLQEMMDTSSSPMQALEILPEQLEFILNDYVATEGKHNRSAEHQSSDGGLKVELF